VSDNARVRDVVRNIDRSVQSLDRLFGALLDLSKLDAGVVTPEVRDWDLAELIERLSLEYRPIAAEKGLEYLVQCAPPGLRTDPILLERILLERILRNQRRGHHDLQRGRRHDRRRRGRGGLRRIGMFGDEGEAGQHCARHGDRRKRASGAPCWPQPNQRVPQTRTKCNVVERLLAFARRERQPSQAFGQVFGYPVS
jgi:hypothetical protein